MVQPIMVQLRYDDGGGFAWHDHTGDVLDQGDITITHGRADFAGQPEPSTGRLVFGSWDFNPANALSPLSGRIGRNTPLRIIAADEATASLDLRGLGLRSQVTTPDDAALNLSGDADWRIDVAPRGGRWRETHLASKWSVTGTKSWRVQLQADLTIIYDWSQDGTSLRTAVSTVPVDTSQPRLALRIVHQGDNGSGGTSVTFYTAAAIAGPFTQLGSTVVVGGGTASWADSATGLRLGSPDGAELTFDGRVYGFELRTGLGAGTVIADPDFTAQPEGTTSFTDGAGRTWTINSGARITVEKTRFTGEVASWTPRQSPAADRWVEAEAAGVLRRLGQGADPLRTSSHRFALVNNANEFWPLDDPQGSTQAASTFGGQPLKSLSAGTQPQFGTSDLAPWIPAAMTSGTESNGAISGTVPAAPSGGFAADLLFRAADQSAWEGSAPQQFTLEILAWGEALDSVITFKMAIDSELGFFQMIATDEAGNTLGFSGNNTIGNLLDGQPHQLRFAVEEQAGNDCMMRGYVDGVERIQAGGTDIGQATLPPAGHVRIAWIVPGPANNVPNHFGQLAMWGPDAPDVGNVFAGAVINPWLAFQGETAGIRVFRLAREEGVPVFVNDTGGFNPELLWPGDSGAQLSVPMGPQHTEGLVELFNQAAVTDDGILADDREVTGGLSYRTGRSRYNQPAALELDYNSGHVALPFDPTIDDQQTRNDVAVTHVGGAGGEARKVDVTGPLGVDAIGRTTGSEEVNTLPAPFELDRQAGWRLHHGTIADTRWPQLTVDLVGQDDLRTQVDAVEVADRITLTGLPLELAPEDVSLLVAGWTETIGSHRRSITFNCVPESAYHIADVTAEVHNRAGFSALWRRAGTIDSTTTSIVLQNEEGPDVTFESDFDIVIGGERMTVTAVGAWSGVYPARTATFTVARAVNGVVKSHPNNVRAVLADRGYIGL